MTSAIRIAGQDRHRTGILHSVKNLHLIEGSSDASKNATSHSDAPFCRFLRFSDASDIETINNLAGEQQNSEIDYFGLVIEREYLVKRELEH